MWQFGGSIRNKLGKQVYKVQFVKWNGSGYDWVKERYVDEGDKFETLNKRTYEIHLENCKETPRAKNVKLGKINIETGRPVALEEIIPVTYPPGILHRMLKVDHLEGAGRASLGGSTNLIMCLLCLGLGLAMGFILNSYMPQITGAFAGPTPTPHPEVLCYFIP